MVISVKKDSSAKVALHATALKKAFIKYIDNPDFKLPVTESLCQTVISLPMHTELDEATLNYITVSIKEFFITISSKLPLSLKFKILIPHP